MGQSQSKLNGPSLGQAAKISGHASLMTMSTNLFVFFLLHQKGAIMDQTTHKTLIAMYDLTSSTVK